MKRTSERKKGMAAARLGMSMDSEDVLQTGTPSSVPEDSQKAVTGRMSLASVFGEVSEPTGGLQF